MNNLFTNKVPNSEGAKEAFHIDIGVKLGLLRMVFGYEHVLQMLRDCKNNGFDNAYLNAFGANVHLFSIGGNVSDPIYNFRICGHHPGEASETLSKLAEANDGEFLKFNCTLKRAA